MEILKQAKNISLEGGDWRSKPKTGKSAKKSAKASKRSNVPAWELKICWNILSILYREYLSNMWDYLGNICRNILTLYLTEVWQNTQCNIYSVKNLPVMSYFPLWSQAYTWNKISPYKCPPEIILEYLWSEFPTWKKFHLINHSKMTCDSVHYIWHSSKVPKSEIYIPTAVAVKLT